MASGIYLHIPFCAGKCHYCSFVSVVHDPAISAKYVGALLSEFAARPPEYPQETLYVGGGTPTVIGHESLSMVVGRILSHRSCSAISEVSVEANPGTLAGFDIGRLMDAGVNRISLGAQSFDPGELKLLGRRHGPGDVAEAVRAVRAGGSDNLNIDLIYALPGQTTAKLLENIKKAIDFGPEHLSLYDLSFEEGTPFFRDAATGRISKPPEERQEDMYIAAVEMLAGAGYVRYEISNFAKPGFECRHNLNYWADGEYLGYGAAAVSFQGMKRTANTDVVSDYIQRITADTGACVSEEVLSFEERRREYIMLALRTSAGIDTQAYGAAFGHEFMAVYEAQANMLLKAGFIEISSGSIRLSLKGVLASSRVITEFF